MSTEVHPQQLLVPPEAAGQRLDRFLASQLQTFSRQQVQQWIVQGSCLLNGHPAKPSTRLKGGDRLTFSIPPVQATQLQAEPIPLEIVYEDEALLVLNKPRGMVVHPGAGVNAHTLVHALLAHCGDQLPVINGEERPGIVHRIDKETSGLLVVAKNDAAMRGLAAQFKKHSIERAYLALAEGIFSQPHGRIEAPIGRDPNHRRRMTVTSSGRLAITHFEVMAQYPKAALLRLRLETGRTHQVRVHLAAVGHPLLGDLLYNPHRLPLPVGGQLLHAAHLGFQHPLSGRWLSFDVPPPPLFEAVRAWAEGSLTTAEASAIVAKIEQGP